jgi:hypothetical protein
MTSKVDAFKEMMVKKAMRRKALEKGLWENFGMKELDDWAEKNGNGADYCELLHWCIGFDLSELKNQLIIMERDKPRVEKVEGGGKVVHYPGGAYPLIYKRGK